jgi:hypothetical protein
MDLNLKLMTKLGWTVRLSVCSRSKAALGSSDLHSRSVDSELIPSTRSIAQKVVTYLKSYNTAG